MGESMRLVKPSIELVTLLAARHRVVARGPRRREPFRERRARLAGTRHVAVAGARRQTASPALLRVVVDLPVVRVVQLAAGRLRHARPAGLGPAGRQPHRGLYGGVGTWKLKVKVKG